MSSYNEALNTLFLTNSSTSSPYKVNQLLYNVASLSASDFETYTKSSVYLKYLAGVVLGFKTQPSMDRWLNGTDSALPPLMSGITSAHTSSQVTLDFGIIAAKLFNGVNIQTALSGLIGLSDVKVQNHQEFTIFVKDIIDNICEGFFASAITTGITSQESTTVKDAMSANKSFNSSVSAIRSMNVKRVDDLRKALNDLLATGLKTLLNSSASSIELNGVNDFLDFSVSQPTGKFYYSLRNWMIGNFTIPDSVLPSLSSDVTQFAKMILVELYLKTCYPIVQLAYIETLRASYEAIGDFVNVRFAMLSQAMYGYLWVRKMIDTANASSSSNVSTLYIAGTSTGLSQVLPLVPANLVAVTGTIINYVNMLNINFKSNEPLKPVTSTDYVTRTKKVVKDLKDMTFNVEQDSKYIANKQTDIARTQLAIRSYNENLKSIQGLYYLRLTEYYILMFIAMLVMIVGGIFILMKKPQFAFFGAIVVIISVLAIKMLGMIYYYFFKKN